MSELDFSQVLAVTDKCPRYEKPWIEAWKNQKKGRGISGRTWDSIIFWGSILLGFILGAVMCYLSYSKVSNFEVPSQLIR